MVCCNLRGTQPRDAIVPEDDGTAGYAKTSKLHSREELEDGRLWGYLAGGIWEHPRRKRRDRSRNR